MLTICTQKVKVRGHSVQKFEWKQTGGYIRTDTGDCITYRAIAIGITSDEPSEV